ncbi:MAG TPA: glycosyltransferase family 4 protein [Thermoanaerobaculia bacterium]|nr:glycosyltransferase family 4 protein [Thermoanaerobaculia bacterium]
MPPLRIIHIAASTQGVPWLTNIVREQARRGHDVRVVLPRASGTVPRVLEECGVPFDVLPIELPRPTHPFAFLSRLITIARYLRRHRADVVQYHLFPSIIMGRLASWIADVPIRISMIPSPLLLESPVFGPVDLGTTFADTRIIATCERTRELYLEHGVAPEKVCLVYYAPDTDAFDPAKADPERLRRDLGLRRDQPVIGFVAYFYPPMETANAPPYLRSKGIKGHEVLFAAAPRVLERYPEAKFVLVGNGQGAAGVLYERRLRDDVRAAGLAHAILFAGERDDIPDTLAACDVTLQCSLCENLGGSIEALTMGRPLIATRAGGLVDSVKHERTGLTVEPENSAELAEAILRLLDDPALAARLGAAGRALMLERFTLRRTADDLDALYDICARSLASEPRRGRYRIAIGIVRTIALPFRLARLFTMVLKAISRSHR